VGGSLSDYFLNEKSIFWVIDSINVHSILAIKFMEYIESGFSIPFEIANAPPGFLTHAVVGSFFSLFGINAISSIFGQFILKVLAIIFIYKSADFLWNERVAYVAVSIYSFCPIPFFYHLTFYKESAVQMLVAGVIFYNLQVL